MKPVDFALHRPGTVPEAVTLLSEHADDVKVLAGGQSLIPLLNLRLARPEHVIDVGRIAALAEIRRGERELVVGSMVRQAQAEHSHAIAAHAPLLAAALPNIGHPPIRNRGTVGGSLAHADPAAELPSVAIALDATFVAVSQRGRREIPAGEFFHTHLTTALDEDELLTEIRVPCVPERTGAAFIEVSRRRGDFALVGVAAQISLDGGERVREARICVSGVGHVPHRCRDGESLLLGEALNTRRIHEAADAVRASIRPAADLHATAAYRRDVAGTLVERALDAAYRDARRDQPSDDLRTA
jgi:carbon-monoxide dehydrogenase medium subunit